MQQPPHGDQRPAATAEAEPWLQHHWRFRRCSRTTRPRISAPLTRTVPSASVIAFAAKSSNQPGLISGCSARAERMLQRTSQAPSFCKALRATGARPAPPRSSLRHWPLPPAHSGSSSVETRRNQHLPALFIAPVAQATAAQGAH